MVNVDNHINSGKYVFRKYQNRKLYDSMKKEIASLRDVIKSVREKKDLVVIDNQGEDITVEVLNDAYHKHIQTVLKDASYQKKSNVKVLLNQAIRKM